MDGQQFDAVVKALAAPGSRRRLLGGLLAAAVAGLRPDRLAAQEEIAAAGNGGTADASANGGAVATGNLNSGANAGNAIGVGDTAGGVAVDGGSAANATSLDVSADGGTAIADASGGDDNVAFLRETCPITVACPASTCGSGGLDCNCFPTTEGGSFCGQAASCASLIVCETSLDCPAGQCTLSCCDQLTCALPCGAATASVSGASAGRWNSGQR